MRFARAAALLCALVSSHAFAQSSPGFTYGQVPTAGQWNQYFSSKQDTLGYVPVNRGGDTMTGKLNFMPATAAAASYNIGITNTVPTSPRDGDVWATSAGLFARINGATYDILSNNTVMSGSSVFANPTSGTATGQAVPIDGSMRFYGGYFGVALPSILNVGGAFSTTATANQFLTGLGTDGVFTKAQPAFADISGTASIMQGGTGQTTASAAFNALSPMTTAGDMIYGGVSGAGTRLPAGTSSQVLIGGTTPSWGPVPAAAIPAPTLGITRSQIPTTTIGTPYQSFIVSGYATTFDGGEGCEWTRATVSAPGAVQSADGAYWALSRDSAIDVKCVGGLATSSDIYPALVAASQIARAPNPGIDSFGQILLSNKYPYLQLATPGFTTYNGQGINGCAAGTAVIESSITSGTAITTTGGGVNLDCLSLQSTATNTATGLQLGVGSSDQAGQLRVVRDTSVHGFERGIYSASGALWQFSNVYSEGWTNIGLEIDNPSCDSGDWFLNGFTAGGPNGVTYPNSKGVHWKCSGGGKITGLKIFYGAYGWYSEPRAGTVDMQFAACSIEGQSVAGMYFVSGAPGGSVGSVTISSCEFGGLPEGIVLVSGVAAITIVGNSCANIGIACIRIEDGVSRVVIANNDYDPAAIPIIDNRVTASSMWGHIDRDYDRPVVFDSDSVWTVLASYTIPNNGYSTKLTLFFEGTLAGSGYITRDMTMVLKNTGSGVSVFYDRDITTTTGGLFDLNVVTSGNTATFEVKRQSGIGTSFYGTMTQHVEGPLQAYIFR